MSRLFLVTVCVVLAFVFAGCASTRQPAPQRPVAPPMIGKRGAPSTPVASAQPPPRDIVIRATAPMESAPDVKPQAADPGPPAPPATPQAVDQGAKLAELHSHAAQRYALINDYICRFRRREVVNGKQEPEDLLEFKFRKAPLSIFFKWIGGPLVGRELIYVKGKYNNELQIRTGKGDPIAGFRTSLDPQSARATANSRRTVPEAGIGNLIESFGMVLAAQENGAATYGTLRYLGPKPRPESAVPMDCVEQTIPPNLEKHLPRGGTRYFFFNRDERTRDYELLVLVITLDETQREVEYYCHDRVNTNVGLKPQEFDPDIIWKRK